MSLPSSKLGTAPHQQSIRSFFQPPKPPTYAPPPSSTTTTPPQPPTLPPAPLSLPVPLPSTSATNPSLPPNATIRAVEPADITALRRLNALLLPVAFPDSFYAAVLDPTLSHRHSRVITWAGDGNGLPEEPKIVGAVVCIPEPPPGTSPEHNLYIRSLGILAPYRGMGLAGAALDDILAHTSSALTIRSVTAHVWTENDVGLAWYQRRGFERCGDPIHGYYRRLRPDSAILVSRPVRAGAVLRAVHARDAMADATIKAPAAVNRPPTTSANLNSDARPPPPRGGSYQNQRSEMEWNDLPVDMMGLPPPPRRNLAGGSEPGSGAVSGASSRSSSSAAQRKKRDRSYPSAAFGT
ncbi:GNAT family acetyltransferase, putative [Cordyceps militaris CM01]|uniref:GNAT family acetyltransferase, putative n=1 Tax=Cordyceps militaris (strain CM01) TaxID=983644 RepID=G3JA29_CORMM|nr:GNAT family acetyltransferase, putative [Cordyceps militaris CM01]EGX95049.1 GNAT family acetyltransferase, putative [Cordyceps militaris CM01]